jgi:Plavaka transposase
LKTFIGILYFYCFINLHVSSYSHKIQDILFIFENHFFILELNIKKMIECNHCNRSFATQKGFLMHHRNCFSRITEQNLNRTHNCNVLPANISYTDTLDNDSILLTHDESNSVTDPVDINVDNNDGLMDAEYMVCVELLALLQKSKCPLYMFNKIMNWARRANTIYQYKFQMQEYGINRTKILQTLTDKFDQAGMMPHTTQIYLSAGLKSNVEVVWHDFEQCLYSLLQDKDLMKPDNLLLPNNKPDKNVFDDVNSGTVFMTAQRIYVQNKDMEILVPIIFFSDKTHTDIHGRLCLEPVQFTLGIFNRATRNLSKAWRTIGYVNDICYKGKVESMDKNDDYQRIMDVILDSYKKCQLNEPSWKFNIDGEYKQYTLKIPTLYIIGDTEGHDKMCGRMSNRSVIKQLCRYCNTDRENTDNPHVKYVHTKMKDVANLIAKDKKDVLKGMSMYCVKNAWHNVLFCDPYRGLHGATMAELLHCLQQGLFDYAIKGLFGVKKTSQAEKKKKKKRKRIKAKTVEIDDDDEEYIAPEDDDTTKFNVFADTYITKFEKICKQYGKYLQHQSDRSIPRTHFNVKYTTIAKKNGHEMAGLLLVFLTVFMTDEGETLDKLLDEDRCGAYVHVLELLLMLESLCKQEHLSRNDVHWIKEGMPFIMETLKTVINRQEGMGMKIIKFHLLRHYAEDIMRFGSMRNFDSSIGERNHCTEVKDPAQHTQRRKCNFELQTANRYCENVAISKAYSEIEKLNIQSNLFNCANDENNNLDKSIQNKHVNIIYVHGEKDIKIKDYKTKKNIEYKMYDKRFRNELIDLCSNLVEQQHVNSPIQLFTQHNREGTIFRANSAWKKDVWYDWANVKWDDNEEIPAQLLVFIDLSKNFLKKFKIGQCYIDEAGCYAIGRSFQSSDDFIQGHQQSKFYDYGKLVISDQTNKPELCMFPVDSITSCCIAVPYSCNDNLSNAEEWLILKAKSEWYSVFVTIIREHFNVN